MPVELVVGVLVLSVLVNLALLIALAVWASRTDHVTLHWPRQLQAVADFLRPRPSRPPLLGAGRRTLYVSDPPGSRPVAVPRPGLAGSGGPNADLAAAVAAAGSRKGGHNGHGQTAAIKPVPSPGAHPLSSTLPRDLAEFLAQPAAIAPDAAGYGFMQSPEGSSTVRAASSGLSGASVYARIPGLDDTGPGAAAGAPSGPAVGPSGRALTIDSLTGLESPASWTRIVAIENARLLRYRRPMTVIMAEVEGLRRLAERLGPEPVDRLLPVIADAFAREARTSDWVARVGESRFGVLLPETDEIQAINYVERIRLVCEPWLASSAVPLRLAIGWSSPTSSTDLEYAIARAEERMHLDRRMPGKALAPRAGAARIVGLTPERSVVPDVPTGSGTRVPPADTGRVAQWGGVSPHAEEEDVAETAEITRARGRRRPKSGPDGDIISGS
jgi:diguanylate cyclase (GGDEF)-like protein